MRSFNLDSPNIFGAAEASERWGRNPNYVRQMLRLHPERFPQGSYRKFGNTIIVTRKAMEALTGQTEKEAQNNRVRKC